MFENDAPFESFTPGEEAAGSELSPTLEEYTPQEIETLEIAQEDGLIPSDAYGLPEQEDAIGGLPAEDAIGGLPAEDSIGGLPAEDAIGGLPAEDSISSFSPEQAEQSQEESIQMLNETALHSEELSDQSAESFDQVLTEE